ncbi:hypothetical protein M430DRAFT_189030 [Amorphotheca resinae ATCC 22711]|uniref:Uncharacterized protein n=1 Tax=Amorphotheca resinae ATCC 22711 TaxID=857342 RepID=A0A2T3ARA3_AMORE|nr:hypothetical protein M430DRAFT_189030 [Amorphotheca resinae ATCC 22711]PSS08762.1 hypothetical protein M430DRAFT_189030 [Amorphotheca resinae ATCC 22711]
MRCSTSAMIMAALGVGEVVAGPLHAHLHRRAHDKRDVNWDALNWDDMGINWSSAYEAGQHTSTVPSAAGYQFTNEFINTSPQPMTVVIWNKAYSQSGNVDDADPNLGSCIAPETPTLTFALAPGESQVVAFMDETLIGWAQATSAKTASGAFDTTWGEASFRSTGSGYDMSAIMNSAGNNYDMAISSSETPCISDPTQNYWFAANNNPEDPQPVGSSDGSCYVPGSSATLVTKMGGVMA